MAKMNNKERDKFLRVIDRIRENAPDADELRRDIFFGKPKSMEKVRIWFEYMPSYQLSKEERDEIRKSYVAWEIFKTLIIYQQDMKESEIMDFYNRLRDINKPHLWFTLFQINGKVSYKMRFEIMNKIMNYNNPNYFATLLTVIDNELAAFEPEDFWTQALKKVVEYINSESKNSQSFAELWNSYIDIPDFVISELDLTSTRLYNETGKDVFLPQEAKDIFLF